MKDLVIIGGGPGGYVAAIRARQLGLDVCLIEKADLGGTCLNRGCIPTKAYYKNAQVLHTLQKINEYNIQVDNFTFDIQAAYNRKNSIVNNIVNGVKTLLKAYKVETRLGTASIKDPNTILVEGEEIKTKRILIATGSIPAFPPIKGVDIEGVITSEQILDITEVPGDLVIIGGGVIGLEFAGIFNAFGSRVTVLESMPTILHSLDQEIVKRMNVFLKKQGITVHSQVVVEQIIKNENSLEIVARGKKGEFTTKADQVLVAGGRKPFTEGLKIEDLGLETSHGFLVVDENFATNVDNIYAIGDVIGGQMLAHVASEEGRVAVEKMLGLNSQVNYHAVPACIFTFPEIATVGIREEEAKDKGLNYKTGKFRFPANGKAVTMGEIDGMVKVIALEDDTIVGIHILGPHASDLILEATFLVNNRIKTSQAREVIHPHPTLGEALIEAILDVNNEAIHLVPPK